MSDDVFYGGGDYRKEAFGELHIGYDRGFTVQRTANIWHGSALSYETQIVARCTSKAAAEAALRLLSL